MSAARGHSVNNLQDNPQSSASASSSPPQKEKYISPEEILKNLKSALKEEKGDWLATLRGHVATELQTVADSYEKEVLKTALQNLLKGELEAFSDNPQLIKDLINVQEVLVIQKPSLLYKVITLREAKFIPSVRFVRFAAIEALKTAAKDLEIELEVEINYEKIVLEDNLFFIADKQYNFGELDAVISNLLERHNLPVYDDIVIKHMLFREAGITEFPQICLINPYLPPESALKPIQTEIPGHFIMDVSLTLESVSKFVNFTNQRLGQGTAKKIIAPYDNLYTLQLNINVFVKKFLSPEFRKLLADYLSNPLLAMNYQVPLTERNLLESGVHQCFNEMGYQYKVTAKGFLGNCLLRTFGIYIDSPACSFNRARRYEAFAFDIDFLFEISVAEAEQLVSNINAAFPNSAKVIVHEKELLNEEKRPVQQIAIKAEVLTSKNFKKKIATTLSGIAKNDIDMLETFQLRSGTITHTTQQISRELLTLAAEYNDKDKELSSSLIRFSLFVSQREAPNKLLEASQEVEVAISGHEATYKGNPKGLKLFKEGNKKNIKDLQRELGTREKKSQVDEGSENSFSLN